MRTHEVSNFLVLSLAIQLLTSHLILVTGEGVVEAWLGPWDTSLVKREAEADLSRKQPDPMWTRSLRSSPLDEPMLQEDLKPRLKREHKGNLRTTRAQNGGFKREQPPTDMFTRSLRFTPTIINSWMIGRVPRSISTYLKEQPFVNTNSQVFTRAAREAPSKEMWKVKKKRATNGKDDPNAKRLHRLGRADNDMYLRALRSDNPNDMFMRSLRSHNDMFSRSLKSKNDFIFNRSLKSNSDMYSRSLRRNNDMFSRSLRSPEMYSRLLRSGSEMYLRSLRHLPYQSSWNQLKKFGKVKNEGKVMSAGDGRFMRPLRGSNDMYTRTLRTKAASGNQTNKLQFSPRAKVSQEKIVPGPMKKSNHNNGPGKVEMDKALGRVL